MIRRIGRALDALYLASAWAAGLLMITLCGFVVWSVLARIIGVFAGGANDVAGYVMASATFLALAYAFRSGGHIRVSLVIDNLPSGPQRAAETLCLAVMAGLTAYLAYFMTLDAYISWDFKEVSEGADATPLWIPKTPVAIGAWIFALSTAHSLIETLFDYERIAASRKSGREEI